MATLKGRILAIDARTAEPQNDWTATEGERV
jgi:hypothetical protein